MDFKNDVAIIGGGPSGAAAARLLASWGRRVVLVNKCTDAACLAESIPPSTRKLFDVFHMTDAIDAAGFPPWRGNTVCWGDERRIESFPPGVAGHHVVRAEFDRLLRSLAADQGAAAIEATVTGVSVVDDGDCVRVELKPGAAVQHLEARFVVDCSGRAGVLARQFRLRKMQPGQRTVALAGVWTSRSQWGSLDPTHTFVETYVDGWVWSVPAAASRRYVTVMVDPHTTDLERSGGARHTYRRELAKATELSRMLTDATLEGGPWGFDASLYTADRFCGPHFLLAGDAGSCLDPLSSFGVKKALASAWLASVVAHTWLERPAMRAAALEFFDAREREMYDSYLPASQTLSASAAAAHAHPFWIDRGRSAFPFDAAQGRQDLDAGDEVEQLRQDPRVLGAFAQIRDAPALRLRPSPHVTIERRPGVAGREIVMQDCIVMEQCPGGLRYLRGVDLPHLVALAPGHSDAGEMFEAYNRSRAPAGLPDFLGALAVLIAWGALEHVRA